MQFATHTPTLLRRKVIFFQKLAKLRKAAVFEALSSAYLPI